MQIMGFGPMKNVAETDRFRNWLAYAVLRVAGYTATWIISTQGT
jgi:hypothetical protein